MASRADEAAAHAAEILGRPVDRIERMVNSSVRAIRLHSGGETLIAARRPGEARAQLEASVLEALHAQGAPVPACLGRRGRWVFQEDLGGQRLSVALWKSGKDQNELMLRGLEALRALHDAARATDLSRRIARLGVEPMWMTRLAAIPTRIAEATGIPAPPLDHEAIGKTLAPALFGLLKWDARPANAMIRDDGRIFWFDWEHCGVRDPLDDAAWFLGDEYAPAFGPGAAEGVAALRSDDDPRSPDEATGYLLRFGVLHSCVRLALILEKRREYEGWRDWDMSLELDKVGCTADSFRRTARNAALWAGQSDDLLTLAPWLRELADTCPDE